MTYPDDPKLQGSAEGYDFTVWVAAAVGLLVLAAIGVWAYVGPITTATAPSGLTGQAASDTGSTTVGAPAGTNPRQTTGQAASPSGSTTTGAVKR